MSNLNFIADLENLERAWRQWSRWSQDNSPYFNAREATDFGSRLHQEVLVTRAELLQSGYTFSPYFALSIPKTSGARRQTAAPGPRDGIVAQGIANYIGPRLQAVIPQCSYAYRLLPADTGSDGVFEAWGKCYSRYSSAVDNLLTLPAEAVFVKIDIKEFYDKIDQNLLLAKLGQSLPSDVHLIELIERLIRYRVILGDAKVEMGRGVPTGPAYGHLLANLYLAEFDGKWSQRAKGYARYVDDIVMVFPSSTKTDDIIGEIDSDLAGVGLDRNTDKTKTGTLSQPEQLVDDVRKKKYRIGMLALQDDDEDDLSSNLRELFQKTLSDLEDVDEVSKVAPHLRLVLKLQGESGKQEQLVTIAYELLSAGIADPRICRLAMLLILSRTSYDVDSRFRKLVNDGDDLIRVMFLRLIIEEATVNPPVELVSELTFSYCLLVRILAFAAMRSRTMSIPTDRMRAVLEQQFSHYADTDSIQELSGYAAMVSNSEQHADAMHVALLSSVTVGSNLSGCVAAAEYMAINPDHKMLILLWQKVLHVAHAAVITRLVNASLLTGDLQLAKQILDSVADLLGGAQEDVFRIGLAKAYDAALKNGDIALILNLGDVGRWHLGSPYDDIVQTEGVERLRQAVQHGSQPMAKSAMPLFEAAVCADSGSPVSLDGATPTITVEGSKYLYDGRPVVCMAGWSYRLVQVRTSDGRLAMLETTPLSVLRQKGFDTSKSWIGYLTTQYNAGTTFLTSSSEYKGFVHTVYHIPEGFHSIETVKQAAGDLNEERIFNLIARIGTAVELTKWAGGRFQSIGPATVFVDVTNSVRFVGLGLACYDPVYGSSITPSWRDSSTRAYQLHLALLAAELFFTVLPNGNEDPKTYLAKQTTGFARTYGYVWSRLTRKNPDHRYDGWDLASHDIKQAAEIQRVYASRQSSGTPEDNALFLAASYLDFRLSIARRDPGLRRDTPRDYVYGILEQYFEEIEGLSRTEGLAALIDPCYRQKQRDEFPVKEKSRLLMVCRVIAHLAENYGALSRRDSSLQSVLVRNLEFDLLLCIVWLEGENLIKSLAVEQATKNPSGLKELISELRRYARVGPSEYARIGVQPCSVGLAEVPLGELISSAQLEQVVDVLQRLSDHPHHDANQLNFLTVPQLKVLSWLFVGRAWCRVPGETEKEVGTGSKGDKRGYECGQSLQTLVDWLTPTYHSVSSHERFMADVCDELGSFIRLCSEIHPFERRQATLLRYNFIRREGKVRFRWGITLLDRFVNQGAVGSSRWERYSGRLIPATVDTTNHNRARCLPMRVSICPHCVLPSRRSGFRSRLHRVFSYFQGETADKIRVAGRIVVFLAAIGLFSCVVKWSWWSAVPGAVFFLLSILWKLPEYLLFRNR